MMKSFSRTKKSRPTKGRERSPGTLTVLSEASLFLSPLSHIAAPQPWGIWPLLPRPKEIVSRHFGCGESPEMLGNTLESAGQTPTTKNYPPPMAVVLLSVGCFAWA